MGITNVISIMTKSQTKRFKRGQALGLGTTSIPWQETK